MMVERSLNSTHTKVSVWPSMKAQSVYTNAQRVYCNLGVECCNPTTAGTVSSPLLSIYSKPG